ncbi:MAG: RNA polymerase sigma factor [Hyphomicrobium sp.]
MPIAPNPETDEALAARAAGGCRLSFGRLVEKHYDRIHRLAWRWTGSRSSAEDIAQDVCVKLGAAIRGYRGDAAFTTWLHRITYTTTLDNLRAGQRTAAFEPSEIIRLIDDSASCVTSEDHVIGQEIWDAVRALPPQQRDAVLLIYAEDMSHAEASTVMGCSEKTVSWHVHEAKKKLKIALRAVG